MNAADHTAFARVSNVLDRHPSIVRALYLFALTASIGYATYHIIRFASITTDENRYDNDPDKRGVVVLSVMPGGASDKAGLRPGDVIYEVNGNPVHNSAEAMVYIITGQEGKRLDYSVLRDGQRLICSVILADYGLPLFLVALSLTGALFMAAGAFVTLRRPNHPIARLYGWTMLAVGLFLSINFNFSPEYNRIWLDRINNPLMFVTWALAAGMMYHLILEFPVRRHDLSRYPGWLHGAIYGIPAVLVLLVLVGIVPANRVTMTVPLLVEIAAVEVLMHRVLRFPKNAARTAESRYMRAAGILALACVVGLLVNPETARWQALFFIMLAIPALLFFSVIRFRVFDLYIVIGRNSLYVGLTAALNLATVVLFTAVIISLTRVSVNLPALRVTGSQIVLLPVGAFPPGERDMIEKRILLVVGVLATATIWIGRRSAKRILDRRFHRVGYDYRLALQEFSQLSTRFSELQPLAHAIVEDLTVLMHVRGAAFLYREGEAFRVQASKALDRLPAVEAHLHVAAPWIRMLTERGMSDAVDNIGARDLLAPAGVEFIAPVMVDGRIEAMFLLGEKLSGTNYARDDVELLDNLAVNVGEALMTMRFYEGAREQERMRQELEIARRIQLSALPGDIPAIPGLDVAALSLPAHEVGGDFYDFLGHHDEVTVLIGDVSGKGTSAALYLARIQGILRAIDSYKPSLWELLVRLNTQLFDHLERQAYLTLSALRFDLLEPRVSFLRAGHLPMLRFNSGSGEVEILKPKGIGIGLDGSKFGEYLEQVDFARIHGDVFVLVTDGITEAYNAEREQFGIARVSTVLGEHAEASAGTIRDAIVDAVAEFTGGGEQHDDQTVLVVRVVE